LLDAKNAGEVKSFYDVSDITDPFVVNVKIPEILAEANRQVEAMNVSGAAGIEWRVADAKAAEALEALFKQKGITEITVRSVP
jgi:hypothetical protein